MCDLTSVELSRRCAAFEMACNASHENATGDDVLALAIRIEAWLLGQSTTVH